MAGAPFKTGVDYHPFSVDFFDQIPLQFVNARFGFTGEAIAIRLLCKVFKNGYFIEFDEDRALLFARAAGDAKIHKLVMEIVAELIKREFFNASVFDTYGVLTSKEIQEVYERICTGAKRKNWAILPEYDLRDCKQLKTGENELTPELIGNNSGIAPELSIQSKVNEIKEDIKAAKPPIISTLEDREKTFQASLSQFVATYGKEVIRAFFDYWREPNKSKTKMRWELEKTWSLNLRLNRWINNQKQDFKNATPDNSAEQQKRQKAELRTAQLLQQE